LANCMQLLSPLKKFRQFISNFQGFFRSSCWWKHKPWLLVALFYYTKKLCFVLVNYRMLCCKMFLQLAWGRGGGGRRQDLRRWVCWYQLQSSKSSPNSRHINVNTIIINLFLCDKLQERVNREQTFHVADENIRHHESDPMAPLTRKNRTKNTIEFVDFRIPQGRKLNLRSSWMYAA
jgi:hypothetical protein